MAAYTAVTLVGTGSSTSPGAGATVASITAPPIGLYEVTVMILLTGTAETALRNLSLFEGATGVAVSLPTLSAAGDWTVIDLKNVEVNEGNNLAVSTNAIATAGAIYNVVLLATRTS
jgi:hypothetical protein